MNLIEKDTAYVWHPFTHLKYAEPSIPIVRGEGACFYDEAGNRLIDGIASWWVNLHGHCHPYISAKVAEQLQTLEHAIFSGFTHRPGVELAERLMKHLPANMSKVFYSDNGSTAVEVGLKMALQYWHNKGEARTVFIALENAYHGDTFGSMSVGARNVFNHAFTPLLFDVQHLPLPNSENIDAVKQQLRAMLETYNVAGFIFEPLVQGAAGMLMYEAEHLDALIALCREAGVLIIADEVMTGFGRTGTFFAVDQLQHPPDIMALSKGLTGGYMPMGLTVCAQPIYAACVTEDKTKTFFHGHSYTANPTACSAALASLDLMEEENTWNNIRRIAAIQESFSERLKSHKALKEVRIKGTILALELNTGEATHYLNAASETIAAYFIRRQILLRPLGNILYVIPPYCISDADLMYIHHVISEFLSEF